MQIKIQPDLPFKGKSVRADASRKSSKSSPPATDGSSSFLSVLEEVLPSKEPANHSLQELWSILPQTEKEFLEHRTEEKLAAYKDLVVAIARQTLERNLRVAKIKRQRPGHDEKELTVVRILDQKLARMLELIRSPENSAFALLREMEEIRGLLYAGQA
ncbi:MAG: DUF327 family protein [Spirochaetales bacterium]|nr:DUF327 family protein [Spirochaetales bacterium]